MNVKKIKILVDDQEFAAELNETAISQKIYQSLPLEAEANFWGEEIYFEIPVKAANGKPTTQVAIGDLAYWPPGQAFCIFYGRTPASINDQPVPASAVTLIGKIKGNLDELKSLNRAKIKIFK